MNIGGFWKTSTFELKCITPTLSIRQVHFALHLADMALLRFPVRCTSLLSTLAFARVPHFISLLQHI